MNGLNANDGMVVITSMVLVFLMLIALCLLITLQGKLFDASKNRARSAAPKKPASGAAAKPTAATMPAAAAKSAASADAVPPEIMAVLTAAVRATEEAIPPEVVAVITAAVCQTMGEGAVICGIRRVSPASGRGRSKWADAGVYETTTPFM